MVKGFSKMYSFSFFGLFFFCKHFYYKTGFCKKNFNFCKFANFFADFKSRAQELSNDVSFVEFGLHTWDLEGGGKIDPPPSVSWFSSTSAGIGLRVFMEMNSFPSNFRTGNITTTWTLLSKQNF